MEICGDLKATAHCVVQGTCTGAMSFKYKHVQMLGMGGATGITSNPRSHELTCSQGFCEATLSNSFPLHVQQQMVRMANRCHLPLFTPSVFAPCRHAEHHRLRTDGRQLPAVRRRGVSTYPQQQPHPPGYVLSTPQCLRV